VIKRFIKSFNQSSVTSMTKIKKMRMMSIIIRKSVRRHWTLLFNSLVQNEQQDMIVINALTVIASIVIVTTVIVLIEMMECVMMVEKALQQYLVHKIKVPVKGRAIAKGNIA